MIGWRTHNELSGEKGQHYHYVARQPILDRSRNTFGYELLFRSSWENVFSGEAESASRAVIDRTLAFGLESIVGAGVPFINCTHASLVENVVSLLPCNAVLEILETVVVDDELVNACRQLRARGYRIALDDFDFHPRWEPLLALADFVKVDFRSSSAEQRTELPRILRHSPTLLIAEKIETDSEFGIAYKEGFHFFQGYFFARPTVIGRPALASVMKRFRLISELRKGELDTVRVLKILKEEASLAVRVLRLANSAAFGRRDKVSDLQGALSLIGQERFRALAMNVLTAELCGQSTPELHRSVLQCGRFCELMADRCGLKAEEMFLYGMLSVLKPILNLIADEIRQLLPLAPALTDALEGKDNHLRKLPKALSNFERGEWYQLASHAQALSISEFKLAQFCRQAMGWAISLTSSAVAA
jgi:EAL and modified HD-GYP domain-containing signal transduction protein